LEDPDCYIYEGKAYFELPARFAWSLTHYDGPMTAIAKYKGDYYYAKCHQSSETRNDRYFWLYLLTFEDAVKEIRYQEWFREYIGFHCDYTKFGKRSRKPENWKEWWWEKTRSFKKNPHTYSSKQQELKIDREKYTKREAIGFFTRYTRYKDKVYS
jgi:hypothetical protein